MLSIVLPYYNRKSLLFNTLKSLEYYGGDTEIIIVDDGSSSEHQVYDAQELFPSLNIRLIVNKRDCKWRTPTIAYNTGFKAVTGDTILINCAECMHMGNVVEYVKDNLKPNGYLTFSCYKGSMVLNELLTISPMEAIERFKYNGEWHLHSSLYNIIPYCAAISKKNMDLLGGYDTRFVGGIGFDDYDFTDRVYNLGLDPLIVDNPFVIHQWHEPTKYTNNINYNLLMKLRKTEPDRIKAK